MEYASDAAYLSLGRLRYRDGGTMIAAGLFDGFYGSFGPDRVRLSGGTAPDGGRGE